MIQANELDLFDSVFTPETLKSIFGFVELAPSEDEESEDIQIVQFHDELLAKSLQTLVSAVDQLCEKIPAHIKHPENFAQHYEKLQALICYLRLILKSATGHEQAIEEAMKGFWDAFSDKQKNSAWFQLEVFEVREEEQKPSVLNDQHQSLRQKLKQKMSGTNLVLTKMEHPSSLDLLFHNLCRKANSEFVLALEQIDPRKREIAGKALASGALTVLMPAVLLPFATLYTVLALPFSVMTSIKRRQIGLFRSIRKAMTGSFTFGAHVGKEMMEDVVEQRKASHTSLKMLRKNTPNTLKASSQPLMKKITDACGSVVSHNSPDIEIAIQGSQIADLIYSAICNANREVMIQTFAWESHNDIVKKIHLALKVVLERKQQQPDEPLKVYVLIDERGPVANLFMNRKKGQYWGCDPDSLGLFNAPGYVEVYTGTFRHNSAGGTHAKTIVIDGNVLILSGANFQASNFGHLPAHDGAVKFTGPIAMSARDDFCEIWSNRHNHQNQDPPVSPANALDVMQPLYENGAPMLLVTRPSSKSGKNVPTSQRAAFLTAIENAKHTIRIATPNLNAAFIVDALIDFVNRGGKLEIMLGLGFNDARESYPGAGGTNLQAAKKLWSGIKPDQQSNCHIRWFSLDGEKPVKGNVAGAAHVKFMAVDDEVFLYGSTNLDNIALYHLHEVDIVVSSKAMCKQMTDAFFTAPFAKAICYHPAQDHMNTEALEIVESRQEGPRFKTLVLKKPDDWNFQPGQFCTLRSGNKLSGIVKKGVMLAIASGANEEHLILTGVPSAWPTHSNSVLNKKVGRTLEVTGPKGTCFPMEDLVGQPLLLIGGGSGITVLRSIYKSLPKDYPTQVLYSAKDSTHLIFQDEINAWRDCPNNFITLTAEKCDGYQHGRFTKHLEEMDLPDNLMVFICGSTDLVFETAKCLVARGVPRTCIYGSLPKDELKGGPVFRADDTRFLGNEVELSNTN